MERLAEHWRSRLPVELQDMVVPPQFVEAFHDDSVPASKWRGYDQSGELCYYHHTYTLWQEHFDENDEPCMRQIEAEMLEAWRCQDGKWLRRVIHSGVAGQCNENNQDKGFELVSAREIPRF